MATSTKDHPSYEVRFQMHWDTKILLNCPPRVKPRLSPSSEAMPVPLEWSHTCLPRVKPRLLSTFHCKRDCLILYMNIIIVTLSNFWRMTLFCWKIYRTHLQRGHRGHDCLVVWDLHLLYQCRCLSPITLCVDFTLVSDLQQVQFTEWRYWSDVYVSGIW